jgi:23S rRNA (uracil1939-C5)-methyltransferase
MAVQLNKGEELKLEVSSAAFEGKAVARHEGLVLFVHGAVPGDVVTARITKLKRSYAEAVVSQVDRPSPLRIQARCAHFGVCGGCKWQHVRYEGQLRFKQQHVEDAFQRIGGFSSIDMLPIIGSSEEYLYRNKMEFSFSDQQWLATPPPRDTKGGGSERDPSLFLGFHAPQRYDKVIDLDECHLQSKRTMDIVRSVRAFGRRNNLPVYTTASHSGYLRFLVVREAKRTKQMMVNLVTLTDRPDVMSRLAEELLAEFPFITTMINTINSGRAQVAFGETEQILHGDGVIVEQLGGYRFVISAGSFFQTNTLQAEKLYEVARSFAALTGSETVFDLYSGTGTIAIVISRHAKTVVGIEAVQSAIDDAERNVRINGVTNCTFVAGDLKDRLTKQTEWMAAFPAPDVVIVDPPRSGMHPKAVEALRRMRVPRIVYVSCNPTTQARDVKVLCEGDYRLEKLQPVDMFPHTFHVENVALLTLR